MGPELLQIASTVRNKAERNVLDTTGGLTLGGVDTDQNEFLKPEIVYLAYLGTFHNEMDISTMDDLAQSLRQLKATSVEYHKSHLYLYMFRVQIFSHASRPLVTAHLPLPLPYSYRT